MKALIVFGTRPEAIKLAPIIKILNQVTEIQPVVCVTGQHREMLDQALETFEIIPDYDLNLMRERQGLADLTAAILTNLIPVMRDCAPDYIIIQGDTTTTLAAALTAYYEKIPIVHIEAGIRSGDIYEPWPEEGNRKLTTNLACLHFAATAVAKENLLSVGVAEGQIEVTGNTVVDALLQSYETIRNGRESQNLAKRFSQLDASRRLILVTVHHRENLGDHLENICHAVLRIAQRGDIQVVFAVHPNPDVRKPVNAILGDKEDVFLLPPQDYISFIYLMERCHLILTDSGGIQEEAPVFGKPVLVLHDKTGRPEAITAGTARIVGSATDRIVSVVNSLLDSQSEYEKMAHAEHPFGDGQAAQRIVKRLQTEVWA